MENFVADTIFIDAPADRVFSALIEPEEILEWLDGSEARIAAGVGGAYQVSRLDGVSHRGTIAELRAPERLRIADWWVESPSGSARGPMEVTWTVEPHDGGVWVTVRQDSLDTHPGWESYALEARAEWVRATVALKRLIEGI